MLCGVAMEDSEEEDCPALKLRPVVDTRKNELAIRRYYKLTNLDQSTLRWISFLRNTYRKLGFA